MGVEQRLPSYDGEDKIGSEGVSPVLASKMSQLMETLPRNCCSPRHRAARGWPGGEEERWSGSALPPNARSHEDGIRAIPCILRTEEREKGINTQPLFKTQCRKAYRMELL